MSVFPLPNLILLNDFNGDWENYREAIYQEFLDNIVNKLEFLGLPIRCKRFELVNNMYRTFWHIITDNMEKSLIDEDRTIDFRRCERIKWIAHIITNSDDRIIKCWQNERRNNENIILWLESENYMIVLSKRNGYYLLTTAYVHDSLTTKRNLEEMSGKKDPRDELGTP